MSMKTIIALLVVVGVLSGIAYWDEQETKKEKQTEASEKKLVKLDLENINHITYQASADDGDFKAILEKAEDVWRIVEPIQARADQEAVQGIITAVKDYKFEKVIAEKRAEWSKYGLEPAKRSLTFQNSDGVSETIYIGSKSPVGYSVYSATDRGEEAYLGSQYLFVSTEKKLDDLRDKSIAQIDEEKLHRLTYKRDEESFTFQMINHSLRIVEPFEAEVDDVEFGDFVSEINRAKAEEFKSVGNLGTDQKSFIELTWEVSEKPQQVLRIVKVGDELWATLDNSQEAMKLARDLESKLIKSADDFKNRKVFNIVSTDVQHLEVNGIAYQNISGEWYLASDASAFDENGKLKEGSDKEPKVQQQVRSFLVDLEFAKADRTLETELPDGLESRNPDFAMKLGFKDESHKPIEVKAWTVPESEDKLYLIHSDSQSRYVIARSTFDEISPKESAQKGSIPIPESAEEKG